MCAYHANFIQAVNAVNKVVPNIPDFENGFVAQFLCRDSLKDCWFGTCDNCSGISIDKLKSMIGETPLITSASWFVWIKSTNSSSRVEKKQENKKLLDLIAHIVARCRNPHTRFRCIVVMR